MFREQVADHYRSKGYVVHEQARVRGASGNIYVADLVVEGPLGNLLVSFGDAGGVDAPEMGSVRRVAKDLGMTPVLAAEAFTPEFRHHAIQNGVVLLDATFHATGSLAAAEADAQAERDRAPSGAAWPGFPMRGVDRKEFAAHPWPESGRAHADDPEPTAVRGVDELERLLLPTRAAPQAARTSLLTACPTTVNAPPAQQATVAQTPVTQTPDLAPSDFAANFLASSRAMSSVNNVGAETVAAGTTSRSSVAAQQQTPQVTAPPATASAAAGRFGWLKPAGATTPAGQGTTGPAVAGSPATVLVPPTAFQAPPLVASAPVLVAPAAANSLLQTPTAPTPTAVTSATPVPRSALTSSALPPELDDTPGLDGLTRARNAELMRAYEARIRKHEKRKKAAWIGGGLLLVAFLLWFFRGA